MSKRIIEIGTEGCYLSYRYQQLIIERDKQQIGSVPIEDLSAVIIDHPQTLITQYCLSELVQANVMVISSNQSHHPIGLFMPLDSNTLQTERFAAQVELQKPVKKALWKQLIQAKIRFQGRVLQDLTGNDAGLSVLVKKVRSGDPANIEAQAARRYWSRLFKGEGFKRDRDAPDQNRFLNYGYAILRALVSRSLCAAGLHPSLGIHHHNRYNAYCLSDDVMEPYRPYVDLHVWQLIQACDANAELDQELRRQLLELISYKVTVNEEQLTLQGAIQKSAQSLAQVMLGERKTLMLPTV